MGIIHQEAQNAFFNNHKGNADIVKIFLNGFDISFATERHISNTMVYAYILKPEDYMKESFGFEKEVLLIYSPYDHMEARAIQAIDELYRQYPFSGRVDALNCFFLSDDIDVLLLQTPFCMFHLVLLSHSVSLICLPDRLG